MGVLIDARTSVNNNSGKLADKLYHRSKKKHRNNQTTKTKKTLGRLENGAYGRKTEL